MAIDRRPPDEDAPVSDRGETPPSDDTQPEERRRRRNRHHAFRRQNRVRPRAGGRSQDESRDQARSGPRGATQQRDSRDASPPTSAQMRSARASGRTPGISTAEEPAAAPLGTDDEAAGTTTSVAALDLEIERAQSGRGMRRLKASDAMNGRPGHEQQSPLTAGNLIAAAAAIVVLAIVAILLF